MSGTTSGIGSITVGGDVTVDPRACNALTDGPDGLVVPRTALTGVAPTAPLGGARSVSVDVVAPAADACPAQWQVGARLAPIFDQLVLSEDKNLVASPDGQFVGFGLLMTLPETGVYEITVTLQTVIAVAPSSGPFNLAIIGRLYNVTGDGPVPGTQATLQRNVSNQAPVSTWSDADLSTFTRFITTNGVTQVRAEVALIRANGTPVGSTGVLSSGSRIAYKKIAD
ncbi:hypothetical protein [Streptomyces olivaceus]|uniref:hypothetical protein n=1 Tax=Streptomyces olivaceus TaxID=47716 RepID=UPI003625A0FE